MASLSAGGPSVARLSISAAQPDNRATLGGDAQHSAGCQQMRGSCSASGRSTTLVPPMPSLRDDDSGVIVDDLPDQHRPLAGRMRTHRLQRHVGIFGTPNTTTRPSLATGSGSSPKKAQAARTSSATGTAASTI